jgi:deoxyuridine 5'-triphosphate nucleotidohydrolase
MLKFELMQDAEGMSFLLPRKAHVHDAGWDLRSFSAQIAPDGITRVRTGVIAHIPPGYAGLLRERSSWAKAGLQVLGGVIDSGYTGEIIVLVRNWGLAYDAMYMSLRTSSDDDEEIMRAIQHPAFAQLVVVKLYDEKAEGAFVEDREQRSTRGFGSTGY